MIYGGSTEGVRVHVSTKQGTGRGGAGQGGAGEGGEA